MKLRFLLIVCALLVGCSEKNIISKNQQLIQKSKIITVDKISDATEEFAKADNETLVVFDVDYVLLEPIDRVLQADTHKRMFEFYKDELKKLTKEEEKKIQAELFSIKMQLVEERMSSLINELQSRGIKTLALTANKIGKMAHLESIEDHYEKKLLDIGINFKKSWPTLNTMMLKSMESDRRKLDPTYKGQWNGRKVNPIFKNGLIFTNFVPKGEVLEEFFSKIPQYKFKKVIFIDDRLPNIESVAKSMSKLKVEFVGFEYIHVKTKKRTPLDMKKALKQTEILVKKQRWVSDEEMDSEI